MEVIQDQNQTVQMKEMLRKILTKQIEREQEFYRALYNNIDSKEQLDKYMLDWHNSDSPLPLYMYLGINKEKWEEYLQKGDWEILK